MLIRSEGRYFSSGADLRSGNQKVVSPVYNSSSARGIRENHRLNLNNMQQLWDEMEHIEKPFVVAHHAMCVGGGLELSLSCDFRLAAKSAGYAFPEGLFGVLPASNGVSRLARMCGPHWARWLIMANKPASAEMAYTMGLVHQVYEDDVFEAEVMDFCRHLAKQNGEQMGAAKIAIELCAELSRDAGRHVERMANSGLMLNPDYQAKMVEYLKGVGGKPKK
jgi:enoyl-CoA hydratase/carnithine racemase